ncbi:MAG: outer membrane lipoprotein carrier protein LolA [Muribaculaceae bacterium]|nr:outer membrane lipoprotein carrier protein LolA [Muribaculaceae bacterium]
MKGIRDILFIIVTIASVLNATGASLTQKEQSAIVSAIEKNVSSMKSMNCSFTQTKHLSLLKDKMISEGKMWYKSPGKLRWEYTTPYKYQLVFNGAKVYVANRNRKDVIDTNSNRIFKEVARIMMETVTGTALSNSGDFSKIVSKDNNSYLVTLNPKKKELKQMFTKIVLHFTQKGYSISEIDLYEKNGDRTNIRLKNIITNSTINENLFTIPK